MLGSLLGLLFLNIDVVAFSSFQSSFSSSVPQLCSHEEAAALLQFKTSFPIDENSKIESWNEAIDCCSWDGVSCDSFTGHVIGLNLSSGQLSGSFSSNSSLFLLTDLQSLNLAENDFKSSKIPSEIGRFPNLKVLDLSYSGFSGLVPGEISHLSKLVSLNLSNYQLIVETTTLRNLVQNLSQVRELNLLGVSMSSVDPLLFMNLSTSLTTLDLGYCDLRGNFPNNIFHFPNLKSFGLSSGTFFKPSPLKLDLPSSNWSTSFQSLDLMDLLCFGKLPESIGDLKSLEDLGLSFCNLEGSIPASIGNLSQLTILDLTSNQLSGPIPVVHPSRFPKLSTLCLRSNLLSGTIPPWIFTLPQLRTLILDDNQLEGQISEFQQNSLELLYLSNNRLHGSIPSSIANQVNLSYLFLSSNNLSGILELDMFYNLQSLITIDLEDTSLTCRNGNNSNFTLPRLVSLVLPQCGLRNFPNFIRESVDLGYLDLSNNRIEGSIPEWMWNIGKNTLLYLFLSNNSFTGGLKQFPWRRIRFLDLQSNKFQGLLPIPPNGTSLFSVSNNRFTGGISSDICNVDTLEILDLSHNNFSEEIPNCLHKLNKKLGVLNLQANKLHGGFPSIFPKECGLQYLNLHGNQMEGALPRSLVNCSKLQVLDVGNNSINDTFPSWLETLTELQVLVLRSNRFHGLVSSNTKANSSFSNLRILDLSDNDFGDPLPVRFIQNFRAMVDTYENDISSLYLELAATSTYIYRFSVVLTFKGSTIDLKNILTVLTSIDLSKNKFVGEIPDVIGKLKSIKGLNLSHNNLGGHIPPSLGNLAKIEWLDLSSNELVGKIPEELASLTFLGTLNLSNNQLAGRIPQGKQFDTFGNDSYQGNIGLCGLPLSKTCGGNEKTEELPASFLEEDEFWEFGWRPVALGCGCGTAVGLLMGYLMYRIGKPRWFVSLVDFYPYLRGRKMNRARRRIQRRNP